MIDYWITFGILFSLCFVVVATFNYLIIHRNGRRIKKIEDRVFALEILEKGKLDG